MSVLQGGRAAGCVSTQDRHKQSAVRLRMADALACYYADVYDDEQTWQWVYTRAYRWALRHLEQRER